MCATFFSDLRRVLLALLPVTLLSLLPVMTLESQESKPSLIQLLTQAEKSLTVLETRLQERKAQIESLQTELINSANLIAQARELRDKLHSELTETSTRLIALETRYEQVSIAFEKYKEATNSQIRRLEIKLGVYSVTIGVLSVTTVAGGVYFVGHKLGAW